MLKAMSSGGLSLSRDGESLVFPCPVPRFDCTHREKKKRKPQHLIVISHVPAHPPCLSLCPCAPLRGVRFCLLCTLLLSVCRQLLSTTSPTLLPAEQTQLTWPLLVCPVLQPLTILMSSAGLAALCQCLSSTDRAQTSLLEPKLALESSCGVISAEQRG